MSPKADVDGLQSLLSALSVSGLVTNSIDEKALCKKQLQVLSECVSKALNVLEAECRSTGKNRERSAGQLEGLRWQVVLSRLSEPYSYSAPLQPVARHQTFRPGEI